MTHTFRLLFRIAVFVLLASTLSGQGWESYLLTPSGEGHNFRDVETTPDGGLIVFGEMTKIPPLRKRAVAIKYDPDGNLEWETRGNEDEYSRWSDGLETLDGYFTAVGSTAEELNRTQLDVLISKLNRNGDILWQKRFAPSYSQEASRFTEAQGGELAILGWKRDHPDSTKKFLFFKTQENGDLIWTKTFDPLPTTTELAACEIVQTSDQGFVLLVKQVVEGTTVQPSLIKTDKEGNLEWRQDSLQPRFNTVLVPGSTTSISIIGEIDTINGAGLYKLDLDGNLISFQSLPYHAIAGSTNGAAFSSNDHLLVVNYVPHHPRVFSFDKNGTELWSKSYPLPFHNTAVSITTYPDNGFALSGFISSRHPTLGYVLRADSIGNTFTSLLKGHVYFDQNDNCTDEFEPPTSNWFIKAEKENGQSYYGKTDSNGNYDIRLGPGVYKVQLVPPNVYWGECQGLQEIVIEERNDTVAIEHAVKPSVKCPLLRVDVGTPLLRRCYENTYNVAYFNEGTEVSLNTMVQVVLDPYFTVNSSSPNWTAQSGDTLFFELGDVEVGERGDIDINVTVDCDSTLLGQRHCVEAQIYPDTFCAVPNLNWDGSTIEVKGACLEDTVQFTIQNVGEGNMSEPLRYIVIVDDVIFRIGNFQLLAQEELVLDFESAEGRTFLIQAEQSQNHPGNSLPTAVVEACGDVGGSASIGFASQFPYNEGNPFFAGDCRQNIGSFDPNDKMGFPVGQGEEHLIEANTDLEYLIRFQNTGTDTAFQVVIRDTLSQHLDLTSLQPGASSHDYELEVNHTGVIKFTFPDIELPDSNINEPLSHGFVQFKIKQLRDLTPGTVIKNKAGIYFDFNAPVITNEVVHTIKKPTFYRFELWDECDSTLETHSFELLIDTLVYPQFDSLILTGINSYPISYTNIDTSIQYGTSFRGLSVEENMTIVDTLVNVNGCDSLVTINLTIITHSTSTWADGSSVSIYPNPVHETLYLNYDLVENSTIEAILYDTQGNKIVNLIPQTEQPPGYHQWHVGMEQLPLGLYFVKIAVGNNFEIFKIIKPPR